MTLTELKAKATELGLTPDEVKQFGHIGHKATWERAINATANAQSETVEDEPPVEIAITNIEDISVTVIQDGIEPLTQNVITPIKNFPIVPFTFEATKPCKPDNSGYLIWDEKLSNWVKEKPSDSSTPYRDKLLAKMMGYVGKGISLNDLEEMQKESPDEATAAIYLGWLEESEAILKEALAA